MPRLLLLLSLLFTACDPAPVGRRCDLGADPFDTETVITTGSLDCESRLCLQVAGAAEPLCTASCVEDRDCVGDPTTPCASGFTCTAVTAVGTFADQPLCVCRDER
jgi:hypothetical protein